MPPARPKLRLFCRRERWVLTAQGWILALLCFAIVLFGILFNLHPFLAVNEPIQADALVVEGWMHDDSLKLAIVEFNQRPYKKLITTGGPLDQGFYLAEYKTFAEMSAATLTKLGFDQSKLVAVPTEAVVRNRTYASALTVKKWLERSASNIQAINLISEDVHARRSWMLYRKALSPKVKVGILATPHPDYSASDWWTTSSGVRTVMSELFAYLYASLFNVVR